MSAKAATALCSDRSAPLKVQVVPGLLDKIADLVLDGYSATSHGGLEIGGVLFGHRGNGFVTVENLRPLSCDHSLGPRFILSSEDERSLRDLLRAPAADPAFHGLEAVGWYCSHTRSELLVLDREVVLHDAYFSGPDDFLIIFKPRNLRSVAAGIFLRDSDGTIDRECPSTIFELPEARTNRDHQLAAVSDSDLSLVNSRPTPPGVDDDASTLSYLSSVIEFDRFDQPAREPFPVIDSPTAHRHTRSRRAKWTILCAAFAAIALLCLGAWRYAQLTRVHPAELFLSLRPQAANLLLSWKSNLVKPQRARVDIFDGASSEHLNLTEVFQPSGVLLFPHSTGNVQAVLTLETKNGVVVRHAGFTDPSAIVKQPTQPTSAAPVNPTTQELVSPGPSATHARRRHARRSRHKK